MRKVFKYQIHAVGEQIILLPKGAEILTVQIQNGLPRPYIWALVEPDNEVEEVKILLYGTGHDIPDSELLQYIGTFQMLDGNLVFHAFREMGN